jgi:hypothetical protein
VERDAAPQQRLRRRRGRGRPRGGGGGGAEEAAEETARERGGVGREEAASGGGGGGRGGGEAHVGGWRDRGGIRYRRGGIAAGGCGGSLDKPRLDRWGAAAARVPLPTPRGPSGSKPGRQVYTPHGHVAHARRTGRTERAGELLCLLPAPLLVPHLKRQITPSITV